MLYVWFISTLNKALNWIELNWITVCRLSFAAFVSNLNAESIIDTWNFPAKTKMESNKRREGMYNIIDLQLMGGLSEHKNGGPGGSMR